MPMGDTDQLNLLAFSLGKCPPDGGFWGSYVTSVQEQLPYIYIYVYYYYCIGVIAVYIQYL